MNGRTGLDYTAVYGLLDRLDLSAADWWRCFDDIRHMEVAVINAMHPGP